MHAQLSNNIYYTLPCVRLQPIARPQGVLMAAALNLRTAFFFFLQSFMPSNLAVILCQVVFYHY